MRRAASPSLLLLLAVVPLAVAGEPPDREEHCLFREVRLAPGEFYAVTFDAQRRGLVETTPEHLHGLLPPGARALLRRVPAWLREAVADRLVDLRFDDLDVGDGAAPAFRDLDGDGRADLVVGNAAGERRVFLAPAYVEAPAASAPAPGPAWGAVALPCRGGSLRISGDDSGRLAVFLDPGRDDDLVEKLERIEVPAPSRPAFGDVTGDGLPDLLVGAGDGTVRVFANHGAAGRPWFVTPSLAHPRRLADDVGYLSSPRIGDIDGDGTPDVVSGAKHGGLRLYRGPDLAPAEAPWGDPPGPGPLVPALGDLDGDGDLDLAVGDRNGGVHVVLHEEDAWRASEALSCRLETPGFAAPCAADLDGDGRIDLAVGASDGRLHLFRSFEGGFAPVPGALDAIDAGASPCPAAYDADGDGRADLVVGNAAGKLRVFLAPDWREREGGLGVAGLPAFAAPGFGDLDGDGRADLLVGGLEGRFTFFRRDGERFLEADSWVFHPTLRMEEESDYLARLYPEGEPFRAATDDAALEAFVRVLSDCPERLLDEAAYAFAYTMTESLRTMARLGDADLLVENARAIYDTADRVAYARLVEQGGGTTIAYRGADGEFREVPREIYYRWVVHPVVEYEFPARVDASFWRKDHAEHGITMEEWTRRKLAADEYRPAPRGRFWRTFLAEDRRYGKNVLDVVAPARTALQAVTLLADWISFSDTKPDAWNEYGRKSDDGRPLVIYEKNYGSCGEQAILGVAFSRTALIPNAPVGCHGEDHAWNEFFLDGVWHTWDVGHAITGLGHPWNERRGHTGTQLLSITRRRGDGVTEPTTTLPVNPPGSNYNPGNAPGYTGVARVEVRVVDSAGDPVEGALVVVRSRWSLFYRTSIWDYTDPAGCCSFELGEPDRGSCVVDVVTPLGLTGTDHLAFGEGDEVSLVYRLPGRFRPRAAPGPDGARFAEGEGHLDLEMEVVAEEQRPRNFVCGRRERPDGRELRERTGYYGTRWYFEPNEVPRGVVMARLTAAEYAEFLATRSLPRGTRTTRDGFAGSFDPAAGDVWLLWNPDRHTHVRLAVGSAASLPAAPPSISLDPTPALARAGGKVVLTGRIDDNLHVVALDLSTDGGRTFATVLEDPPAGPFSVTWDTGAGGPLPPGQYRIVLRATDGAGLAATTPPAEIELAPSREFTGQAIRQDDADSPLSASWRLGPFLVAEGERFLGVEVTSDTPGLDLDLFLMHDKNGNRRLDGMNEQVAKSTSPTATETIVLRDPKPGAYWLLVHGWKVPEGEGGAAAAIFDASLSFDWRPALLTDLAPARRIAPGDAVVTGRIRDGLDIDSDSLVATRDGVPVPAILEEGTFRVPLLAVEPGAEVAVVIRARTRAGLADEVALTLSAKPAPAARVEHVLAGDEGSLRVTVTATGDAPLESARARIDDGPWSALDFGPGAAAASREIDLAGLPRGSRRLVVEYRVAGGALERREATFRIRKGVWAEAEVRLLPGDGAKVYDPRQTLAAYFSPGMRDRVEEVALTLDGEDVRDLALVTDTAAFVFPAAPLAPGWHLLEVAVRLRGGGTVEAEAGFEVTSMDAEEKGK